MLLLSNTKKHIVSLCGNMFFNRKKEGNQCVCERKKEWETELQDSDYSRKQCRERTELKLTYVEKRCAQKTEYASRVKNCFAGGKGCRSGYLIFANARPRQTENQAELLSNRLYFFLQLPQSVTPSARKLTEYLQDLMDANCSDVIIT